VTIFVFTTWTGAVERRLTSFDVGHVVRDLDRGY
jgi:hypothetical protein